MTPPIQAQDLKPGAGLIYGGEYDGGFFAELEKRKLGSEAVHFEVYIGVGKTVTSKFKTGVGVYDFDPTALYRVVTPKAGIDIAGGLARFNGTLLGKPYGYLALLNFVNIDFPDRGLFCSETGTEFYRMCGFEPFNRMVLAPKVAPRDYLYVSESIFDVQ